MSAFRVAIHSLAIILCYCAASTASLNTSAASKTPSKNLSESPSIPIYDSRGYRLINKVTGNQPQDNPSATTYAHLIIIPSTSKETYDSITSIGKFKKVRGYSIYHKGQRYDHWVVNLLGQDINRVRTKLYMSSPKNFYNITPYTIDDRLTSKTSGIRSFSPTEIDPQTGKLKVWVLFHEDVSEKTAAEFMRDHFSGRQNFSEKYVIAATLDEILNVAKYDIIRLISEYETLTPLLNQVRSIVNLSRGQIIDTTATYPSYSWCEGNCAYSETYLGRNVWVAVYDTGIDSIGDTTTLSDFREIDTAGLPRLRRANPSTSWQLPGGTVPQHATHVAGIIGGNGWNSSSSGGSRFLWRGIAPKSLLISKTFITSGWDGHVNNHSHIFSTAGYYSEADRVADSVVNNHNTTHVKIAAAANSGTQQRNGSSQRGYYSLLVNAKNTITVGSVQKDTALRSGFSSMGPTRDGRIKPDIAAPGSSYGFPQKYPHRLKVDIDYIRFIRIDGTVAKSYDFTSTAEGWGDWYGNLNFTVSGGALSFESWNHYSTIINPSVTGYIGKPDDSIVIRYRMRHPQIPERASKIYSGFGWNGSSGSLVRFAFPTPDTNSFQTFRARLRDLRNPPFPSGLTYGPQTWPTGSDFTVSEMTLAFIGDTSAMVYSTNLKGSSYPAYFYDHGTSMAAPVVTGIAALMLEKWKTEVIPGANLNTHGPWNSTIKAILVHTATDLTKEAPDGGELGGGDSGEAQLDANPDLCSPSGGIYGATCTRESVWASFVKYHKGPDYATGYGLVNAEKALDYTDNTYVLQDSIEHGDEYTFTFRVPQNNWGKLRLTLAWDDVAGNPSGPLQNPRLVNNLDVLVESPSGALHYPWKLDPLPQDTTSLPPTNGIDPIDSVDVQPAYKGINSVDNVEVVDVEPNDGLEPGVWKVVIKGTSVTGGDMIQDFSLVADYKLKKL